MPKYIDRKGNIITEETGQDKLLRHLYQDWGGKLALTVLVRPFVSYIGGLFLSLPLSRRLVPGFIRRSGIDMSDYEDRAYRSYNDFFTRRILPGRRPLAHGENTLISPCDGKVSVSPIGPGFSFLVKGRTYTAADFLQNDSLAAKFEGGYAVILRLTVDNYHHYIYPAGGLKSQQVRISGVYHTVNPVANEAVPVYTENTREYCLIRTEEFGTIAMAEVGALMVGKICNLHSGRRMVCRGGEKGHFAFGGSTIVLLLQGDRVRIDEDLIENTKNGFETIVLMGERIGVGVKGE